MLRRNFVKLAVAAPVLAHAPRTFARDTPLPAIGAILRVPDVPLFDGTTFRADRARGHPLVIYWWASWCPFCAIQTPYLQQLWVTQRTRGLLMLGLSVDNTEAPARAYLAQHGYTFPTGLHTPAIDKVLPKPGKGLPVTCVLGRDGRVVMAEQGQLFPEDIEQIGRFV